MIPLVPRDVVPQSFGAQVRILPLSTSTLIGARYFADVSYDIDTSIGCYVHHGLFSLGGNDEYPCAGIGAIYEVRGQGRGWPACGSLMHFLGVGILCVAAATPDCMPMFYSF